MTTQNPIHWIRNVRVEIGDLEIQGVRIAGSLKRNSNDADAGSELRLYNLSDSNRNTIVKDDIVRVFAGYGEQLDIAYTGEIQDIDHPREEQDRITTLTLNQLGTRDLAQWITTKHYETKTSGLTVLKDILVLGGYSDAVPAQVIPPPPLGQVEDWSADAPMWLVLLHLLNPMGVTWNLSGTAQDGRTYLTFGRNGLSYRLDIARRFRVAQDSGMVGVPSRTDEGVEGTVLLNAAIIEGSVVEIESVVAPDANGQFKVVSLEHKIDTHEDEFVTFFEAHSFGMDVTAPGGSPI